MATLTEIMELFHSQAEEISSEHIAKAVESAITLLGNASSQMSALRQTCVLQEYNQDLVVWAQQREEKFIEAAPALFGQSFPKDVTEYLDQVASLKKAKATAANPPPSSSLGFRKAYSHWPSNRSAYRHTQKQRPAPYYPQVHPPAEEDTEMTIIDKQFNECICMSCKQYSKCTCMPCFKAINYKPYITESYGDGVCGPTKGKGALYGGRETGFLYRHLEVEVGDSKYFTR